ncbi:uncharacterized protein LOC120335969 isoform X2 [Styela clava]|nr:uncharacterized protein LOC120335969 isoform X2 [Styela clava]
MRQVFSERYSCIGSAGDIAYDSPKLPRPSNDFNNVMVKFRGNVMNVAESCPTYGNRLISPISPSHGSDTTLQILPLSSALSPNSGRRRPTRNVHFDETTITVTAEMGESAARFRSRWRQKNGLSSSPPIKFGTKNIVVRHDELSSEQHVVESSCKDDKTNLTNRGKSIFDACNYSQYGRYT